MKQPWKTIGFVWALPLTLVGFFYVTIFCLFGWYSRRGHLEGALVYEVVPQRMPTWLYKLWRHWSGQTIGAIVVLNANIDTHRGRVVLRHEMEHVRQGMVLGVFFPVLYMMAYLGLKCCKHAHPYYDNPFEIDARKGAGQVVDVIGALRRAVIEGKVKALSNHHK